MTPQQKTELTKLLDRARYRNRAEDRDELVANLEWAIAEIEALQAALNQLKAKENGDESTSDKDRLPHWT